MLIELKLMLAKQSNKFLLTNANSYPRLELGPRY